MADIEPYKQMQKTNIKEHNDLVGKINEIVEVINQTNLDTITPKVDKLEQDVSAIKATDALQWKDIESTKDKNAEQDNTLAAHATELDGITRSLVSDVVLMNGTTVGNMKVRIEREDAPSIDSDDYNLQKPTSVELVQGSAPATLKAQITLSDGSVLISDDFMFTTEAIGSDVYISSFVFKNGNVAGTISADIGLSNGTTLEANNFAVPTDPNVTSAISDLQSRITAVESGSIGGLDDLKRTVNGHTTSINALNSDVAELQIDKADVTTVDTLRDTVNGKVNVVQGTNNAGKVLGINDSGSVVPISMETGTKALFTGDISELITGTTGKTIVHKDIEILYLINFHSSVHSTLGVIKAGTYTVGDGTNVLFAVQPCIIPSINIDGGSAAIPMCRTVITNTSGSINFKVFCGGSLNWRNVQANRIMDTNYSYYGEDTAGYVLFA